MRVPFSSSQLGGWVDAICEILLRRCLVHGASLAPISCLGIQIHLEGENLEWSKEEGAQTKPISTFGTLHPENQIFHTHGVSLPRTCSSGQQHVGFGGLYCSPGLQRRGIR